MNRFGLMILNYFEGAIRQEKNLFNTHLDTLSNMTFS
jgi:hypothetical protein